MTVENIDVNTALEKARKVLNEDKELSSTTSAIFQLLITIVTILLNQKTLNSRNSSKPPSQDPNRPRKVRKDKVP